MKIIKTSFLLFLILVCTNISSQSYTRLFAPDSSKNDLFGLSIYLKYPWLFVGAAFKGTYNSSTGTVYLYKHNGQNWIFIKKLKPIYTEGDRMFGKYITGYGNKVAIGAPEGPGKGAVYIYQLADTAWIFTERIQPTDGTAPRWFGDPIDIYKERMIIGAMYDVDNGLGSGAAYTYQFNGSSWKEQQKLLASDGANGDKFGSEVTIYDTAIAIGVPNKTTTYGLYSGSVYIFTRHVNQWLERMKIFPNDILPGDQWGYKLELDNNNLYGSSPSKDQGKGAVYQFHFNTNNQWIQQQKIILNNGAATDQLGSEILQKSGTLFLGVPGRSDYGTFSGEAVSFQKSGNQWIQGNIFSANIWSPHSRLGYDIESDGSFVIISAPGIMQNNLYGIVYTFMFCGESHIAGKPDGPMCPGDSIHLFAGCNTDSVNWYHTKGLLQADSHSYNFAAYQADTLWAGIWNTNGLLGYDTVFVQIEPKAAFSTDTGCLGQPTHFTDLTQVSTPWHYQWDFDNDGVVDDTTQGSTTFTYPAAGNYSAKLMVENLEGCRDSVLMSVEVGCIGIKTRHSVTALQLNPNPANQEINISWSSASNETSRLEIIDALGRRVYRQTLPATRHQVSLNIASWPAGLYLLRIKSAKGAASLQWVKE